MRLNDSTARLTQLPSGPSWELAGDLMLLGASRQNDITLDAHGVSRFHARLRRVGGQWRLEDDGSRNGTWSGKTQITRQALSHGDELRLGDALLRYEELNREPRRLPWQDLMESSRRPQLIRIGVAALAALLVVGASLLTGSSEGAAAAADCVAEGDAWEQANAQLRQGELDAASKLFRRLAVRGPVERRNAPRVLHRLAEIFAERRPEAFRWKTAGELLARAAKLEDLPDATQDWIHERTAWVESGRRAYAKVQTAKEAERRARAQLEAGHLDQATAALEEALRVYASVDPESPLGARATGSLATLRTEAYQVLLGETRHMLSLHPPEVEAALGLVDRAEAHATLHDQHVELRTLRATCLREQQDLASCQRAVRILRERRTAAYPEALELLKTIDPRSDASAEARMWSAWLQADTDTRRADALYTQGDARSAVRLLDKVQATRLDDAALQVVLERRERWAAVGQAWERARKLTRAGDPRAAQALEDVLQLEPDRANHYNELARRQLSYLDESDQGSRKLTVERGLSALRSGDYMAAHRAFEAVRLDPARARDDGARIALAVREANREHQLVAEGQRALMTDSVDRFEELEVRFELLWRWLHPQDPERRVAKKCLRVLIRRRAVLAQVEAQERAS